MAGKVVAQGAQRVLTPPGHRIKPAPQFLLGLRGQPRTLSSISLIR